MSASAAKVPNGAAPELPRPHANALSAKNVANATPGNPSAILSVCVFQSPAAVSPDRNTLAHRAPSYPPAIPILSLIHI